MAAELRRRLSLQIDVTHRDVGEAEREARVTAQLEHPNIVRIHDFGIADDHAQRGS